MFLGSLLVTLETVFKFDCIFRRINNGVISIKLNASPFLIDTWFSFSSINNKILNCQKTFYKDFTEKWTFDFNLFLDIDKVEYNLPINIFF